MDSLDNTMMHVFGKTLDGIKAEFIKLHADRARLKGLSQLLEDSNVTLRKLSAGDYSVDVALEWSTGKTLNEAIDKMMEGK